MQTQEQQDVRTHLRHMRPDNDLPAVLAIEAASFDVLPWDETDFRWYLRRKNCVGVVTEMGNGEGDYAPILGYMVYEFDDDSFHLLDLAVRSDYRRRTIGRHMVTQLLAKLTRTKRRRAPICSCGRAG